MTWREARALYRYHADGTDAFAEGAVAQARICAEALAAATGKPVDRLRILEIGSGQRYQNVLIFRAWGADIIGIDLEAVGPGLRKYGAMLKADGPLRLAKSVLRALAFDRRYFKALSRALQAPLPDVAGRLIATDAAKTGFDGASFDAVISTAVFEHLSDVAGTVKEMRRILKPGGVARIAVHLFPSISGGHHLGWQGEKADGGGVPAWDHLLEDSQPSGIYLNRWRKAAYLEAFSAHLEMLSAELRRSGEDRLDAATFDKLQAKGYSRDELLETELLITARAPR